MPDTGNATLNADDKFLKRSDCTHRPDPNQTSMVLVRALHLDGKSNNLDNKDGREDIEVTIAAHKVFHKTAVSFQPSALSKSNNDPGFDRRVGLISFVQLRVLR